jgi:hypothetical protein
VLIVNDVNYGATTLLRAENFRRDPVSTYYLLDVEFVVLGS